MAGLEFDIGGSAYQGRVLLGNKGVEASLRFAPQSQAESPRHAQSDKLGFFSVLLKHPGDYDVAVRGKSDAIRAFVRGVKVSEPDEPITIRLPEGRIEGFVVDEQDKGVAGARVFALCVSKPEEVAAEAKPALGVDVTTSPDGRFELNGLDTCRWLLTAQAGENRGGPVAVVLAPNQRVSGLRLRVAKGLAVSGRVLDAFGRPIGGAGLQVGLPADAETGTTAWQWLTTDSEGRFSFVTSRSTACIANLEVAAAGLPVSAFRVPTAENVDVHMPQSLGSARRRASARQI
ncbi:MAG: carboxypeptidase-like regulatory domain-containing protein [Thermoanaerobaculum sp.]